MIKNEVEKMSRLTVKTPTKTDYEIILETSFDNLLQELNAVDCKNRKVCLISDDTIYPIYGSKVKEILESNGNTVIDVILEQGSISKTLEDVNECYKTLLDNQFIRSDFCVALGGSIVADFAGFVSATYKRGLKYILLPTTLQAMVDSSIGGKVSLDLNNYRNVISMFYTPAIVYINSYCLETLNDADYYSGFADIMKTAMIKSSSAYEWLIDNLYEICDKEPQIITDMIEQTLNIKKIYVEKDMFDVNDRHVLNLGNPIGYALEYVKGSSMKHGECLALGVICAAHISMKREMLSLDEYLEIRDMFVPFNLPITIEDIDIDKILEVMNTNKKHDGIVLLKKIGKAVFVSDINDDEIKEALKEIRFSDEDYVVE